MLQFVQLLVQSRRPQDGFTWEGGAEQSREAGEVASWCRGGENTSEIQREGKIEIVVFFSPVFARLAVKLHSQMTMQIRK